MFTVASVALTLVCDLAEPFPLTETSRSDLVDVVYETLTGPKTDDRAVRMSWARLAGGEVR